MPADRWRRIVGSAIGSSGEGKSMDEIERPDGISRRRMLKRVGAGAAIAWAAPVLTSLQVPAFAQAVSSSCSEGFVCGGPFTICSQDPLCACTTTTEGAACLGGNCTGVGVGCTSSAECEALIPGSRCQPAGTGCCGNQCIPACGSTGTGSAGSNTAR